MRTRSSQKDGSGEIGNERPKRVVKRVKRSKTVDTIKSVKTVKRIVKSEEISTGDVDEEIEVKRLQKIKCEPVADMEDMPQCNVFKKIENPQEHWQKLYNAVVELRGKYLAPVDLMGCERIPDAITPKILQSDPKNFRFQLLISLMLSSQTKDEVLDDAMRKLTLGLIQRGFNGISLDAVQSLTDEQLDNYIGKVGFHNRKTVYIKKACIMLQEQFNGDIPKTIEDIVKLPGVGPKMGYLLLQRGWNITSGIGVDVHLHRLAMMWGWASKTLNPENTRKELESWLPQELWGDINPLLVGFGQVICTPQVKNCDICSLSQGLCKSVNRKVLGPLTQERINKLMLGRGNLEALLNMN